MSNLSRFNVANLAALAIGETTLFATDADLDTSTKPTAAAVRAWWDTVVGVAFALHPWPFATQQAALVERVGAVRSGWLYVYSLPAGCVTPLAVLLEGQRFAGLAKDARTPFEVFPRTAGLVSDLACDLPPTDTPVLEYVGLATAPQAWPNDFAEGVSYLLASKLALAIKKDAQFAVALTQIGTATLSRAYAHDLAGGEPGPEPLTPSLAARG